MTEFTAPETWSVGELSAAISETLSAIFPTNIWVRGEITGLHIAPSGHAYFTLVEQGASANRNSDKLPVALFARSRATVEATLADQGLSLEEGIEVRIGGNVSYYATRSQVQIIMSEIDPNFTLGQLAANRAALLAALQSEGLLDKNRLLALSPIPLRVGLVTSDGSAACADFLDELANSGYAFEVVLCDSRVQGAEAPQNLVNAITTLQRYPLDVIAVVRGGGDRNDLLAFDTEPVARAVANCALPVVVGIGHETDESVVDHVAHAAYKTPTACADALVEMVAAFYARLGDAARSLSQRSAAITQGAAATMQNRSHLLSATTTKHLGQAGRHLAAAAGRLQHSALIRCNTQSHALDAAAQNLSRSTKQRCKTARVALASHEALARSHDPQRVLERGFSITRNQDGSIVRARPLPKSGDEIATTVAGGTIHSTVTD